MNKPGENQNRIDLILRKQKPANLSSLPADIQYLLDDKIGPVIAEGLNTVYRVKPHHPIDFFAKWLLNYEATQGNKNVVHQNEVKVNEIIKKYDEAAKVRQKIEADLQAQKQLIEKFESIFREKVNNHEYHEELLANDLPSFIEKQRNLPAVYIGMLEHPTKALGDDEEEEFAHLDAAQPKLISYIGASGSQKFMLGRELLPDTGVTYPVFDKKVEEEPPAETQEGEEVKSEPKPNYVYIPDVTKEPKIVYFRIPKLGAYMACPLSYKSVLSEKAFEEGVKERKRVEEEREKQKVDKEQRDADYQTKIQEAQAAGAENIEEIEEEWKNFEWPEIKENPFEFEEKKFVLCVDTLGEDREISEEDRKYVSELAQTFVKCWEESERKQLSRDIDLYIYSQKAFNKEEFLENLTKRLNDEMNEKFRADENDSELNQNYLKASVAAEFYRTRLMEDDVKDMIKSLANHRVVKFRSLIQNVLYFLRYKKGQVNLPGKNILDWKEVKKMIVRADFFTKLNEYEFKGPKEGYWEKYALVNRLVQKLEKINVEELEDYNLGLAVLYRFVKQVLEARILDVQVRRAAKEQLRKKREEALQEAENLKAQKEKELEEAKAAQDQEEFNQEQWEAKWIEDHPPIQIPPEVESELDEDYEGEA